MMIFEDGVAIGKDEDDPDDAALEMDDDSEPLRIITERFK
jgi:hypothetical protein